MSNKLQHELMSSGEPAFGSIYDSAEEEALLCALKNSINPSVGFRATKEVEELESDFAAYCIAPHAIALNGAGTALDLVLKSLKLSQEDEVISCAINFPGTHLAVIGSGAKLILCEPEANSINIDVDDVASKITANTKAVLVTNMNGLPANLDKLKKIIEDNKNPIKIICDAARSLGAEYKGLPLGNESYATIFSLQSKKMITALGEGGIVVTKDNNLAETLRDYRAFGRGQNWGSNFKMSKLQAAVARVQFAKLHEFVNMRRKIAATRNQYLADIEGITIIGDTPDSRNAYYLYTVLLPKQMAGATRDSLRLQLQKHGIGTVIANEPTYKANKLINRHTQDNRNLPRSEEIGKRIICLCIHPGMNEATNEFISTKFKQCFESLL